MRYIGTLDGAVESFRSRKKGVLAALCRLDARFDEERLSSQLFHFTTGFRVKIDFELGARAITPDLQTGFFGTPAITL